jgi:Polyketide cyclase / dehydrase and lipid transport
MALVRTTIDVAAPVEAVFDYAMDPQSTLEWVTIVRGLGHVDAGPLREGFRMEQSLCLRGVTFTVHWVLTELDRPWFARWDGRGPARSIAIIENSFAEHDGATRFDYSNDFRAPLGPLGAVASRALVGGVPEREALASLEQLKARLEGDAGA